MTTADRTAGRNPPDRSDGSGLRALARAWRCAYPTGEAGRPDLVLADTVDSTQRWARSLLDGCLADDDEPEPFLCAAIEQHAGRGRDRRTWISAPGGIYATIVLRPANASELQSLPARAAIAMLETVRPILGDRVGIKWPNDLVVGRKKVGGVLVDALTPAEGAPWALVGFGLNHSQREFGTAADVATSLAAEVGLRLPFFEETFAALLAHVARSTARPRLDWLDRYRELSVHRAGDPIRARLPDRTVDGRFVEFDGSGFLVLDTAGSSGGASARECIRTGEVFAW